MGASRLGDLPPVEGGGTLVALSFEALAGGAATVEVVESRALDGELRPVGPVRTEAARILVQEMPESPPREKPSRPEARPEI